MAERAHRAERERLLATEGDMWIRALEDEARSAQPARSWSRRCAWLPTWAWGFPFEHGLHSTLIRPGSPTGWGSIPATASQTYYACLLAHAGCTTDAHVTAEIFGDSLTTHLNPVMYGSGREVLSGLLRALPQSDRAAPVRVFQVARRLPRMVRGQRPHLTAMCEVAGMLAGGVGLPPSVEGLLAHLTERWDGRGPLRRAKGEEIPLPMRIVHARRTAPLV